MTFNETVIKLRKCLALTYQAKDGTVYWYDGTIEALVELVKWLLKDEGPRCNFCGGKLSEVRTFGDKKVRHCFGCHFDYEVDE